MKLLPLALTISIFSLQLSARENCPSSDLTNLLPDVGVLAQRAGADCIEENRDNSQTDACACVSNLPTPPAPITSYSPSILTQVDESHLRPQKIALMHLSNEVSALAISFDPSQSADFTRSCNLEKLANVSCPNGNSALSSVAKDALINSFRSTLEGNSKTTDFDIDDLVKDRSPEGCLIPDNSIIRVNKYVNTNRISFLLEVLSRTVNSSDIQRENIKTFSDLALFGSEVDSNANERDAFKELFDSSSEDPLIREFLNSEELFSSVIGKGSEGEAIFDSTEAVRTMLSQDVKALAINEVARKCNGISLKLEQSFCQPSSEVQPDFETFKMYDALAGFNDDSRSSNQRNSDLQYFCHNSNTANPPPISFDEFLPVKLHNGRVRDFNQAFTQDYGRRIKSKKVNLLGTETAVESLAMCDYIPQPGKPYKANDVSSAIEANCGPNKEHKFAYKCLQAEAVAEIYGPKLEEIENLESLIRTSEAAPTSSNQIQFGGVSLTLEEAKAKREVLAENLFSEDKKTSAIVTEFVTGKPAEQSAEPVVTANSGGTRGEASGNSANSNVPNQNLATSMVAATEADSNEGSRAQNSNQARSDSSSNSFGSNYSPPPRSAADVSERDSGLAQSLINKIEGMRREINESPNVTPRTQLADFLRDSSRDIAPLTTPSRDESLYDPTQYADISVGPNGGPTVFPNNGSAAPVDVQAGRERALSDMTEARRADAAASGRAPAGSSAGSLTISGGKGSAGAANNPNVVEISDTIGNDNLNIIDIALENQESANQLIDLIQDNDIRSFVIRKGDHAVTIYKRGGRLVVSSDGQNEADTNYSKFLRSMRRTLDNKLVQNIIEDLRGGSFAPTQYKQFRNASR